MTKTANSEFVDFLTDLLSPLGGVSARAMFGGWGVYKDGVMFGLVADEQFYLKATEDNIPDFEAEGCGPFIYYGKGKAMPMSYWLLPERLYEDQDLFLRWATKSRQIATALKLSKKSRRSR